MNGIAYKYKSSFRIVSSAAQANDRIASQIISFSQLPDGWHYGEGRGGTDQAVKTALAIYGLLRIKNAEDIEVFPDISGGILVAGYHDKENLEIFAGPDGRIDVVREVNDDIVDEKTGLSWNELEEYVRGLLWKWKSMRSSDYFIPSISAKERDDLKVWLSKILQTREVYQLSTPAVLEVAVEPNVNTYIASTTLKPQVIPPYCGEYQRIDFQRKPGWSANLQQTVTNVI